MIALIVGIGLLLVAYERSRPGWALPRVRGWWGRVLAANLAQAGLVTAAGALFDGPLRGLALVDLGGRLPAWAGGLAAYVVSTFVYYWWHRLRHDVPALWAGLHQLHHSPRRIEVVTSFYKHPLEMASNALLSSIIAYALLGLTPSGGAAYTLLSALGEFFYHLNVRTPRWLGLFFQRPEMHRYHHESGEHRRNYADLPLWDMLFGTYHNPPSFEGRCGFDEAREAAVGAMLAFRDVHEGGARP